MTDARDELVDAGKCVNGHDDWYVTPAGKRRCRTCRKEREAGVRPRKSTTKDTDGSVRIAQRTERDANGCLVWMGQLNGDGYGVLSVGNKYVRAHRQSWENANGPVPDGLELDHLCRNRACVEPNHLEPVTTGENVRRGLAARKGKK